MKSWIIATLMTVIAIGSAINAFAANQTVETTANVDVTVWQRLSDGALFLSTRPERGAWKTHDTALDMSQLSRSGNFRQGSAITVGVPVEVAVEAPESSPSTPTPTQTATPSRAQTYSSCSAAEAARAPRYQGCVRGRCPAGGRGFLASTVPSARDGDGDGIVCER